MRTPSKFAPKTTIQEFAERELWFLRGEGPNSFGRAVRALAEETCRSVGWGTASEWTEHAVSAIGRLTEGESDEVGISVISAPVETTTATHESINSLGENDECYEDLERVVTEWTPWDPMGLKFILTIYPGFSRDKMFKQLREWFWKFSKENPPERRRGRISPKAVFFNLAVVRLDRASFGLDEIECFIRQFECADEKNKVTKDVVRDARKYVRRLIKRITHRASCDR